MDDTYQHFKSPSGLTLLSVPMTNVESVTILVMVRTGSRDEPKQMAGISHFLEHMVFKGTEKYPSTMALTSTVDAVGGEFNAFTGKEYTGFYVKLAVSHFPLGLDILSQLLSKPLLLEEEVKREKSVILEEIKMYEDLPPRKVAEVFDRLIYGASELGRAVTGTQETVKRITGNDLRAYLGDRYVASRAVIGVVGGVAAGGFSLSHIEEMVGEKFGVLKEGNSGYWGAAVPISPQGPQVVVAKKEINQAHYVLGFHAYPHGHQDRFALAVLATLLGGNMSSRLYIEIRERQGLAYYVKADVDDFFDTGSFSVQAGVDTRNLPKALAASLRIIAGVRNESGKGSVTEEEVKRAKECLKGRFILSLEDSQDVADHYVREYLLQRKALPPSEFLAKIEEVSRSDVIRVAADLFSEKNVYLSVVGPYKKRDGQGFEKLLHLG